MKFLRGLMPAGLAGAFFLLTAMAREIGGQSHVPARILMALVAGWLLGVAVVGLIRLFRVAAWAYPLAGLICGPVPFAVLGGKMGDDEWGGIWFLSSLFGAVVGTLEFARRRREEASGEKDRDET